VAGAELRLTDRLRAFGVDEADVALVLGEPARARDGYRARIARDPDDVNAWVGLGLAIEGAGRTSLGEQPELARAVYRARLASGTAPDPVELAEWLGQAAARPEQETGARPDHETATWRGAVSGRTSSPG
jgi:hypothetical protein